MRFFLSLTVLAAALLVVLIFTPLSDHTGVEDANGRQINVPVYVHIVEDSRRNASDAERVFLESNRIWSQASIKVEPIFVDSNVNIRTVQRVFRVNRNALNNHNVGSCINLYFAPSLHANGVAVHPNMVFVNDLTTVNDFRTAAHEIGHLLGLRHVGPVNRLMASGVNGELLVHDEINTARAAAQSFANCT